MIKSLSLFELQQVFGGEVINGDATFQTVSTDTRSIAKGDVFVALKGERFDAHNFLAQAVSSEACSLVVEKAADNIELPQWCVADTTVALGNIANQQRKNFSGKMVAITGSGGKTTVKELLANIFEAASPACVFATRGNLNNHIGVPLSLLSLTDQHQYAVIEMGASAVGEIDYLTHIAQPDVALVNNVMPAHVEGFGSVDGIATAKGEIYGGLSESGVAVVNVDDFYAPQWLEKNKNRKTITFSCDEKIDRHQAATIKANDIQCDQYGCAGFNFLVDGAVYPVQLNVLGEHNVANALAAAACAYAIGIDINNIVQGLQGFTGVAGRLQRLQGVAGSVLIDDSYNANPGSMEAAINVLARVDARKILIVGDMGELGEMVNEAHKEVGRYAKSKNIDALMAVGEKSRLAAEAFSDNAEYFSSQEELVGAATEAANNNTVFLIKGSRSSHMDKVVDALKQKGDDHAGLVS